MQKAITGQKRVWVVGSSIVKHAFVKARTSYDGVNMGLQRCNATVWWQGQGGMRWNQLERKLTYLLTFEDPPDYLVLHCGGNDIGHVKSIKLRKQMEQTMKNIRNKFPKTCIIWSQILPRFEWRSKIASCHLNKIRIRINRATAKAALRSGGAYIRYP